jgi:hypothetical protein
MDLNGSDLKPDPLWLLSRPRSPSLSSSRIRACVRVFVHAPPSTLGRRPPASGQVVAAVRRRRRCRRRPSSRCFLSLSLAVLSRVFAPPPACFAAGSRPPLVCRPSHARRRRSPPQADAVMAVIVAAIFSSFSPSRVRACTRRLLSAVLRLPSTATSSQVTGIVVDRPVAALPSLTSSRSGEEDNR